MSRLARSLTRLFVGLSALVLTGLGSTAFASVGPPDNPLSNQPSGGGTLSQSVAATGMTWTSVLLIVAAAVVLTVALTEAIHRIRGQRPVSSAATV